MLQATVSNEQTVSSEKQHNRNSFSFVFHSGHHTWTQISLLLIQQSVLAK